MQLISQFHYTFGRSCFLVITEYIVYEVISSSGILPLFCLLSICYFLSPK